MGGGQQLDKEAHPQGEGNLPGLEGKGPPGQVTSHPWEGAEAWEDEEWVEGIIYLPHGGTFESQVTGINHLVTGVKGVMAERYIAQLQWGGCESFRGALQEQGKDKREEGHGTQKTQLTRERHVTHRGTLAG